MVGTAQDITAQNLAVLRQSTAPDDERARQRLSDCDRLVDRSAREIRTLSYLLHPPMLEEFGLERALREYAKGFAQRSGLRVELDVADGLGRLPRDLELALFRVFRRAWATCIATPAAPARQSAWRTAWTR